MTETGSFLAGTRPRQVTVTIPTSGTATASTADDRTNEADGTVTLTVTDGRGYTVATPPDNWATVTVTDSDQGA